MNTRSNEVKWPIMQKSLAESLGEIMATNNTLIKVKSKQIIFQRTRNVHVYFQILPGEIWKIAKVKLTNDQVLRLNIEESKHQSKNLLHVDIDELYYPTQSSSKKHGLQFKTGIRGLMHLQGECSL